ncbi:hypothetical protein B0H19DRAFT_1055895 [Mycena capillaripes]|nr:hypothetical protein B0H19DRAFT_1055895 [Mycena capillaripes]
MANENNGAAVAARHGSNNQRRSTSVGTANAKSAGGRKKKTNTAAAAANEEIERLKALVAELSARKDTAAVAEETGHTRSQTQPQPETIDRREKPPGEACDRKNGFVLIEAMGLDQREEEYEAMLRYVHRCVARADLDIEQPYRKQDMRKKFAYLTEKRFHLNWATAEMVKQYLRNKRRYGVRRGYILSRDARKRQHEDTSAGTNKRRKTGNGAVRHIDDDDDDDDEDGNNSDGSQAEGEGMTARRWHVEHFSDFDPAAQD